MKWKQLLRRYQGKFQQEDAQKRAFVHMVKFFLMMLLLTLIARGTSGALMARVELTTPIQYTVTRDLQALGTVEPREQTAITVPGGLAVDQLVVEPGTFVEAGDPLVRFDAKELETSLARKNAQLKQLKVQLQVLQNSQNVPDDALTAAQRGYDQAYDAWEQAKTELTAAEQALKAAEQELQLAQEALASVPEEEREMAQTAVEEATAAVALAEERLAAAMAAEKAANLAAQDASDRLEQEKKNNSEAQEQAYLTNAGNAASAELLKLDIAAAEEEIRLLEELQTADYCLTSPIAGEVLQYSFSTGITTNGSEQITMAVQTSGYQVTFQANLEDVELLRSGRKTLLLRLEDAAEEVAIAAASVQKLDDDMALCCVPISNAVSAGQTVEVSAALSEVTYSTCVPLSALHQDAKGYFVYVYTSQATIWGIEDLAVRVDVGMEEMDSQYVAVFGELEQDAQIISGSNKPLSDGDRVRVEP